MAFIIEGGCNGWGRGRLLAGVPMPSPVHLLLMPQPLAATSSVIPFVHANWAWLGAARRSSDANHFHQPFEQSTPIITAVRGFDFPLGVGHHPKNIACSVEHARDVAR